MRILKRTAVAACILIIVVFIFISVKIPSCPDDFLIRPTVRCKNSEHQKATAGDVESMFILSEYYRAYEVDKIDIADKWLAKAVEMRGRSAINSVLRDCNQRKKFLSRAEREKLPYSTDLSDEYSILIAIYSNVGSCGEEVSLEKARHFSQKSFGGDTMLLCETGLLYGDAVLSRPHSKFDEAAAHNVISQCLRDFKKAGRSNPDEENKILSLLTRLPGTSKN